MSLLFAIMRTMYSLLCVWLYEVQSRLHQAESASSFPSEAYRCHTRIFYATPTQNLLLKLFGMHIFFNPRMDRWEEGPLSELTRVTFTLSIFLKRGAAVTLWNSAQNNHRWQVKEPRVTEKPLSEYPRPRASHTYILWSPDSILHSCFWVLLNPNETIKDSDRKEPPNCTQANLG